MTEKNFNIDRLGSATMPNPIGLEKVRSYFSDEDRICIEPTVKNFLTAQKKGELPASMEIAGPRDKIFFNPTRCNAAIVTCGGLCPGINDVIRALVMHLWHQYSVKNILGIRYGYNGLGSKGTEKPWNLTPEKVVNIHEHGGSILGMGRGTPPVNEIVDSLVEQQIDILFTIGGDGTMRGASNISKEIKRRNLKIATIGIPKTIDNDIPFVRRSFGFETAVGIATQAVLSAHNEAQGSRNGIGLIKLMGRHAGYIAASTAIATGHANFCFIPEVPFKLEGEHGLLKLIERRYLEKKSDHTVIIVAEGAGQEYFSEHTLGKDPSGNSRLGDIGVYMKEGITKHFNQLGIETSVKYIDPSYLIRSAPANSSDSRFCSLMAQMAVHGAMSGKTAMLVGFWHGRMTYIPMSALDGESRKIRPHGDLWLNVLETTGQPFRIGDVHL